jgi:2-keto-4-pentenoate hydratase/2-oxohepta-3-ene-1,7-dioic acid hydratase in catechol pathway
VKLATFTVQGGAPAIGAVDTASGTVLDLQAAHRALHGADAPTLASMLALIEGGDRALDLARGVAERSAGAGPHRQPLAAVRLLSPVPVPPQIRDLNNFEEHMRNAPAGMQMLRARLAGKPVPERASIVSEVAEINFAQPTFYISNRFSVVGHDAEIEWPSYSAWFDYEGEFGFFIGRKAKNVPAARAGEHIFGYAIFNDFSARDKQMREMEARMGPTKGKSFDTGNAIGPWIVTRDEIPDARALEVTVRINGERIAHNTTAGLIHSFEDVIAYLSTDETLHPGEFIGSGTVGTCCALENDRWLKDGDVIEVEYSRIGVLRNRIVRRRAAA